MASTSDNISAGIKIKQPLNAAKIAGEVVGGRIAGLVIGYASAYIFSFSTEPSPDIDPWYTLDDITLSFIVGEAIDNAIGVYAVGSMGNGQIGLAFPKIYLHTDSFDRESFSRSMDLLQMKL